MMGRTGVKRGSEGLKSGREYMKKRKDCFVKGKYEDRLEGIGGR